MTNTIPIDSWIEVIDREYLSVLIKDGGSSVKFAVTNEEDRPRLLQSLRQLSSRRNCVFVPIDASECRVYMPQDLFFTLAEHVDWRVLARRVIINLLREEMYSVDGIDPLDFDSDFIASIATANRLDPSSVKQELRPILQDKVFRNTHMVRAFRSAMRHLCLMEFRSTSPYDSRILDWLTGTNPRIGNVRDFEISTPINRTTARYMIESALYWIRRAGYLGTVMHLDNSRVLVARNPKDDKRYYTRPMTVDHYELLREFIDDIGRLHGLFLAIATGYDFVDDESKRGWSTYIALQARIMDDVRDKNVVNPVSALIRLSSGTPL